jgi:hypothetical protein
MPSLFTYIVAVDKGIAPNPFKGLCSLAVCKPAIRRTASEGDWVAGFASKRALSSGRLVYAMRVEKVLSFEEYDREAKLKWPYRLPNIQSADLAEQLGDCIYDYSNGIPVQRLSARSPSKLALDLSGKNVIISNDFYYFGSVAEPVPEELLQIVPITQGHRRKLNDRYYILFEKWLRQLSPHFSSVDTWL